MSAKLLLLIIFVDLFAFSRLILLDHAFGLFCDFTRSLLNVVVLFRSLCILGNSVLDDFIHLHFGLLLITSWLLIVFFSFLAVVTEIFIKVIGVFLPLLVSLVVFLFGLLIEHLLVVIDFGLFLIGALFFFNVLGGFVCLT